MAMQLRTSSSSSSASFTRDVFLSFRGVDTREGFTGHLFNNLRQKKINIFIDDDLRKGDEISEALLRAIEDSKLSIIVFSENYASSKWCLNELVHILKCRKLKKQMVHPIFYKVDPSDVRHQTGKFGESLARLEARFKDDKVSQWRAALSEAATLSGRHFSGGYEYEFIDKIISDIFPQVYEPTYLDMPECQVGLDSRVNKMLEILDVGGSDVRMVGIWGIGGIGKTTIAKAVYNAIAHKFDGCCFLANVREDSKQDRGLVTLQNILLSSIIVRQIELKLHNVHEGITLLRKSLRHKKILLVIDDVDSLYQLEKLAGSTDWFGCGSRVIVTTRDKNLLTDRGVEPTYSVRGLGYQEALVLLSSKALLDIENLGADEKLLVTEVVRYAQGIPLALEVLGSHLCDTSVQKWRAMLDGFKKDPPKSIQDILLISYDGLQNTVRNVFLDIACYFKGRKRNDVIQIQLRASSSFSSASSTRDVFLSFRGKDTREGFTGHLYNYLLQKGINTFIDDDLRKGGEISEALLRAIEDSKLSIIVFSENYASSKWCLNELVHILECRRLKNQMVLPIFYKVDPSDVRHQTGKFGESLARLEPRFKDDKVLQWREALLEAATLSGWHFSGGYEYEFIDKIISDIFPQVYVPTYLDMPKCQVGLDTRVKDMLEILDVGGSDIRMVGIWGIGGIGKTTIAKAVYNAIARTFDGCCFLANVREGSEQHGGLVNLQNIILSTIARQKETKINNVDEGITLLRECFRQKRVLLVVDDVNSLDQLKKLAGRPDWYGRGSRVIITTRDRQLLIAHQVKPIYDVNGLDHQEALVLFNSNALLDIENLDAAEEPLVTEVVKYAQGIPLALEVLGSHLCDTSVQKWRRMLDGFKKEPRKSIQDILLISYVGLENTVRNVFLDIACFFKGRKRNDVIQILEGCDPIDAECCIKVLEQKALIHIDRDDKIRMHDLLEDMGKGQVLKESTEAGERSRLWYYKDVQDVLTKNKGTSKIEGMMVKMPTADEIRLSPKCFKKMKNLKIFINVNGRVVGKVDHYPNQLRLLDWPQCPLQFLPSNFNANKLVQLNMCQGRISRLGEGFKRMQNLKSLKLSGCEFLAKLPDMSGSPKLEVLDLSWCQSLVEIHPSVGLSMQNLKSLKLSGCKFLAKIPDMSGSPNLEVLDLSNCERLVEIPDMSGSPNLEVLDLFGCRSLVEVHPSVGYLEKLVKLDITECSNLVLFLEKANWKSLKELDLLGCSRLEIFPEIVGEMRYMTSLWLVNTAIKTLPSSIRYLINLEKLYISDCGNLKDLPCSIYDIQKLVSVELLDCPKLVTFPNKMDTEVLPTYAQGPHDDPSSSSKTRRGIPWRRFCVGGCNVDFLASLLGRASILRDLDLQGSTIVILPEWIKEFVNLWRLNLSDCKRLVEIPELPPSIESLHVRGCVSLERISMLSNILERKESQMIKEMDLIDCWRLCVNLFEMANKEDDDEVDADVFCRLLSSQIFQFWITFPVPRSKIPRWFSCQMNFMGCRGFDFWIETLPNFKWANTGLAFCVVSGQKPRQHDTWGWCEVFIEINEESVTNFGNFLDFSRKGAAAWVHYIPILEMWKNGCMLPLPPFTVRVVILLPHSTVSAVCGIHLVMPPKEDICMKLIRAQNITSVFSSEEFYKASRD